MMNAFITTQEDYNSNGSKFFRYGPPLDHTKGNKDGAYTYIVKLEGKEGDVAELSGPSYMSAHSTCMVRISM